MSGLCGWIGRPRSAPESATILADMSSRLPRVGACQTQSASGDGFGLALVGSPTTGHWCDSDTIYVAAEGYPRWSDSRLASIAAAHGHGKAMAEAYSTWGDDLFQYLRGTFAFAIIDGRAGQALLAVDRFGVQQMCFAEGGQQLLFGSTTDAIAAHPDGRSSLSPQAIHDYLYFIDRVPAPRTIYREQRKLVPAQSLSFADGRSCPRTYWTMPYRVREDAATAQLSRDLVDHLRGAVGRIVSSEPVARLGTFLSGGLDSSTMAGLFAEQDRGARAFTIGFDIDGFDETPYAELAAKHFGLDHHLYRAKPEDVLSVLSAVVEIYDEPFANSSAVPTYLCARLAREAGVEMLLAGDGGDELFAGNSRYLEDGVFDHYQAVPRFLRDHVIEPALGAARAPNSSAFMRRASNYVRYANMSVAERLTRDNVYAIMGPDEVFDPSFRQEIDPRAPVALVDGIFEAARSPSKLHGMLHLDLRVTLADSDIRKVSRMCELAGLRVTLWDVAEKDEAGNVLSGAVMVRDVHNAYIRADRSLVAAIGLDAVTIIETADAVLVASRERVDEVSEIVARLREEGRAEHASHVRVHRPWGYYETVDAGERFQVKYLNVKPGGRLSLQLHHHRAEHWVVVRGTAQVTRGDEEILLTENQSTYIPIGIQHRLANPGEIDLDIIEIQSGAYLGEDDIRLDDVYGRAKPER